MYSASRNFYLKIIIMQPFSHLQQTLSPVSSQTQISKNQLETGQLDAEEARLLKAYLIELEKAKQSKIPRC